MARQFNSSSKASRFGLSHKIFKQKGAALIFMAFILGLGAAVFALKTFNVMSSQSNQDKNASLILARAKDAIIAYSMSRTGAGERPGDMPSPDYFAATESPANFDGDSDGGCLDSASANGLPLVNSGANMRCLGRLPWRTIGMTIPNPIQNDVLGNMPWYGVSANLVDPACMKVINPSILNMGYTIYQCNSATNLPHPWITIKDKLGNTISNRVAVVLLLPRAITGTQSRPEAPLSEINNYLEAENSDFDNTFTLVAGDSSVNDRLVFITIDELMEDVGRRVSSDASIILNKYKLKNTRFPYAAPLDSPLNNFISSGTGTKGMLPIDVTDNCSCSSAMSCSCGFNPISSVAFTRGSGAAWTSTAGIGCVRSGATCTCTGAGSCTRGSRTFRCLSNGLCTHNLTGTNRYVYTAPIYADIKSPTGGCIISSNKADCSSAGTFSIGLLEPLWFKDNLWQDYLYYEWSATSNLQLGTKGNLSAILINAGNMNTSEIGWVQNRPSVDVRDYLDSLENTNGDNIFESGNKKKTSNYNDQTFVVAP